jgi:hypothetical protein
MEPRYLGCYGILKGRRASAILSGLLLVWAQLSAAPALPACAKQPVHACCHCGGKMSCCSAPSGSQPMPAVPANAGPQKQLSISAPAIVAVALPENRAALIGSASRLCSMPDGAPLYARDCARLI